MSFLSSIAPVLGTGLGALFAAPTGGMSLGMGALIGGMAGTGVSSALSASEAADAQKDMNSQNIASANATNATAIELANTAHQREVKDLAAAGLNPILSSKYGGSSTPSLTVPHGESLAPTILNSAKQSQDVAYNTQALGLQAALQRSQVSLNSASAVKAGAEAQRIMYENDVLAQNSQLRSFENKHRNSRPDWQKRFGLDVTDSVGSVVGPLKNLFK